MEKHYSAIISEEHNLPVRFVDNTIRLLEEGASIPFISRYRKELTGGMDEVSISLIHDELHRLHELDKRRETVLNSITEQGKLTDELKEKILQANSMTELEDIYLPFRPKRKTRASIAKERGLEPLAKIIMKQFETDPAGRAAGFVKGEVTSVDDALKGARDIISEWINENEIARKSIRLLFEKEAILTSTVIPGKEEEGAKYKDYFESKMPLKRCPSHRMLAIRRGESEGFLSFSIFPEEDNALKSLERIFVKGNNESSAQVKIALKDAYKRLLQPSIETEFRLNSKIKADEEAIRVFVANLRQLLLAPPLGNKRILAIDPGFRTGCKLVCIDEQGRLLHNETIYPHQPQQQVSQSSAKLNSLVEQYKIDAIAIGDGTAGRETEWFVKKTRFSRDLQVFIVNEDGASIYSASAVAREEFPQFDVTVRGAVSIGRRLMDPLAELVKIDAKSIGVGQYQHDVDQNRLKESLDRVVESCVNLVGVNLNTASKQLLSYVSGIGPQLAQNIVDYRNEHGPFSSRNELKEVGRLGDKAFEQSAGFLRIPGAVNPLDNSAVHPESYSLVERMAKDAGCEVPQLIREESYRKNIDVNKYVTEERGIPTLTDILNELAKPGRDPRNKVKVFEFSSDVRGMDDLRIGMILPGIVSNITKFGAFVDIGVKQDGLVHISQLADRFVSDPAEVVTLHQHVRVKVIDLDLPRKRIQLSIKDVE